MKIRVCNHCDVDISDRWSSGRCTNGRCRKCCDKCCTPGGVTGPGHGIGKHVPEIMHKFIEVKEKK